MDLKLIFFFLSLAISFIAYIPYVRDMLRGDTKPHAYTWLIWSVTAGIGTAALWHGGGGYPVIGLGIATLFCFLIFLLSFKFGTRDIKKSDTVALVAAGFAVFAWVQLNDPLLSLLVGTSIDVVGYWPSVRKSFAAPWSESLSSWLLWSVAVAFSLLALNEYNIFTVLYYGATIAANITLFCVCLFRRRIVPRPV